MEETAKMFFKNKGLKRMFITTPLMVIFLYIFFNLTIGKPLIFTASVILPGLIIALFFPYKYAISDDNSIEFYHVFGKSKSKTIQIKDISEISFNRSFLQLYYRNLEDAYPKLALLELSEHDVPIVVNELQKRNPAIEIS